MSDMRPMKLKDTVEMMGSQDYKERFKAEWKVLHYLNKSGKGE